MDYLEQALEPIPLPATPPPSRTASDSSTKLPPSECYELIYEIKY